MSDPAATGRSRERPVALFSLKAEAALVRALERSRESGPEIEAMRALHLRIACGGFLASMVTVAAGCAFSLAR
jgi:hypothetical protein